MTIRFSQIESEQLIEKLLDIDGALLGIGALFKQQTKDPYYESKELFGLGRLFCSLAEDKDKVQNELRSGKES